MSYALEVSVASFGNLIAQTALHSLFLPNFSFWKILLALKAFLGSWVFNRETNKSNGGDWMG